MPVNFFYSYGRRGSERELTRRERDRRALAHARASQAKRNARRGAYRG